MGNRRGMWWIRRLGASLVLAMLTLAAAQSSAESQEADAAVVIDGVVIFPDAPDQPNRESLSDALTEQLAASTDVRFVDIDVSIVRQELDHGNIQIEIATDASIVVATVFGEELVQGAVTWTAEATDGAALALVTRGDALTGEVRLGDRQWGIAQVDGRVHAIFEHTPTFEDRAGDQARMPQVPAPDLPDLPVGAARFSESPVFAEDVVSPGAVAPGLPAGVAIATPPPSAAMGPTTVIDVMVVYDDTALAFHGSATAIENLIITNIASANAGFATSAVDASLNLVHIGHVAYTGSGDSFTDLTRLRNPYDGQLDSVHGTRDAVNADLVTLVSELVDGFCGRANLLQVVPTEATDDQAFGVVGAGCLTNNTYLHEIGHNMGSAHDDANTGGLSGVHPYSRGWVDTVNNFVTVMSYANGANGCSGCTTINQFSSTTELFGGFPTGDVDHQNAATLDITRAGIAAYRPDPCPNPANDDFPVRVDLGSLSNTSIAGTNICASIEDLETYFIGDEPVESVWYEWTSPFAGTAHFSTCDAATTFDTTITVFDDAVFFSSLSVLAYNDDAGAACAVDGQHSEALATVVAGQTVRFKVDGSGAQNGNFVVHVQIDTTCDGVAGTVYLDRGDHPTSIDDVIIGTSGDDTINALEGNDVVCAGSGVDIVNGGPGNDRLFGEDGDDTIFGVDGDDFIEGGNGLDILLGFAGTDTIDGGPDRDIINGGLDGDVLNGGGGNDDIFGQGGNDVMNGGAGADLLIGLDGIDTISGDDGQDVINGGVDADFLFGGNDGDTIYGLAGDDQLNGDAGDDFIFGQLGADTIDGGSGADNIWGNEENDTITDPSGVNIINGGAGDDDITGGADADSIFGDGTLAQAGNDTIDGGAGLDLLLGFAGDDTITSDDGAPDTVNGGPDGVAGDTCIVDVGVDNVFNCEN